MDYAGGAVAFVLVMAYIGLDYLAMRKESGLWET